MISPKNQHIYFKVFYFKFWLRFFLTFYILQNSCGNGCNCGGGDDCNGGGGGDDGGVAGGGRAVHPAPLGLRHPQGAQAQPGLVDGAAGLYGGAHED